MEEVDKKDRRKIHSTLKSFGIQMSASEREYKRAENVIKQFIPEVTSNKNWRTYLREWIFPL